MSMSFCQILFVFDFKPLQGYPHRLISRFVLLSVINAFHYSRISYRSLMFNFFKQAYLPIYNDWFTEIQNDLNMNFVRSLCIGN